jgi:DNA-binding transcriptional LysR family regulator
MNWDDLRFILAVADAGSLAAAARELRVTLPTAMRRLDQIEASLGARVFERHRQGYACTEAGELLVREARAISPRIDELQRQVQGRDLRLKGRVRLTTASATVQYLLSEALSDFTRAHPGISVEVLESGALLDLSRAEADVALRFSRQPPEHWVGRQLGTVQYRVYAKRGAAGLPRGRTALDTLLTMSPWIEFGGTDNRCSRWMQSHLAADQVRLRIGSFGSMVALLRSGCGLGLLPSYVAAAERELVAVSDDIEALANPAWLLTHPDVRRTARIQAFMRVVGDAVSLRLGTPVVEGVAAA